MRRVSETRTAIGAVVVAVVLFAAAAAAVLHSRSTHQLLPAAVAPPPSVTAVKRFDPPGADVSVRIPADWVPQPSAVGFGSVMVSPSRQPFVLVGLTSATVTDASTALARRQSFLRSHGATITGHATGKIDGHPADRLDYTLPYQHTPVSLAEVEYDVLLGSPGTIQVVLGQISPPNPANAPLVDWVASTIRVELPPVASTVTSPSQP
jgi:hypothetical protein